jgi:hypothetical protein
MSASENLKKWFDGLPLTQQREVVQFLYGGKALLTEGMYMGPRPGLVQKGLYCGPAPTTSANVCPTCGRPF